jgi:hypothetical protein
MLDTFGFPTPQGSNYQEFYGGGSTRDWLKPRGASMVRMLLIGAGGGGGNGSASGGGGGGGSGAVTEWIGPAIFIPDQLRITIGAGGASQTTGGNTTVLWQGPTASAGYTLLTANGGSGAVTLSGATAGAVSANNYFGASGIFSSTAGQNGSGNNTAITASTTVFLSGGSGGSGATTTAGPAVATNYGYPSVAGGTTGAGTGGSGYFITQPIMLGTGGAGGGGGPTAAGGTGGKGGIGCGGGGAGRSTSGVGVGGRGGDGAVFIWSW